LPGVINRAAACVNYAEAGETVVYAVRENGQVLYFDDSSSAYTALLLMVACPAGGGLLGLVAGILLLLVKRKLPSS
jgi:Na+-translocating ferredoxin:NAD+ oxidoreductase RnfD subunit